MATTLYDRVKMSVTGTPGTGAITLGGPILDTVQGDFLSFAQAGIPNGATVSYTVIDGHNWGKGHGVYTSAGTSLARDAAEVTWNGSTVGSTPIALTSAAIVMVTALAADILPPALAADVRAGSSALLSSTPKSLADSCAWQVLTDASTIAWDAALGYNARVTLTASGHTIGAPTNLIDGLTYSLEIIQNATGSMTVVWNTIWDFGAYGLPVLQTGTNKADKIHGQYNARTGKIEASYRKGA